MPASPTGYARWAECLVTGLKPNVISNKAGRAGYRLPGMTRNRISANDPAKHHEARSRPELVCGRAGFLDRGGRRIHRHPGGNWNDAQRDREAEALYLDRLHREIAAISQRAEADYAAQHDRLERIEEVREFFATGTGIELLDGRHCGALSQSHIFADTIFYPPTIKELIATGRIVLIRDDAIRTAILSFDQTNEVLQAGEDGHPDRPSAARTDFS